MNICQQIFQKTTKLINKLRVKEDLQITLIQPDLYFREVDKNLNHFTNCFKKIKNSDIVFLPETFNTSFCPELAVEVSESMDGKSINWMLEMAKKNKCAICGTIFIREGENIYNRFCFVEETGSIFFYDKKHLFSLSNEAKYIKPGGSSTCIIYKGWKIFPQICYDLRFPVFSRNTIDYHLLVYLANWPTKRINAWDALLRARSIENQCYVVGVNRKGKDYNDYSYSGNSVVFDPNGEKVLNVESKNDYKTTTIFISKLSKIRKRLPFLSDRDQFSLK